MCDKMDIPLMQPLDESVWMGVTGSIVSQLTRTILCMQENTSRRALNLDPALHGLLRKLSHDANTFIGSLNQFCKAVANTCTCSDVELARKVSQTSIGCCSPCCSCYSSESEELDCESLDCMCADEISVGRKSSTASCDKACQVCIIEEELTEISSIELKYQNIQPCKCPRYENVRAEGDGLISTIDEIVKAENEINLEESPGKGEDKSSLSKRSSTFSKKDSPLETIEEAPAESNELTPKKCGHTKTCCRCEELKRKALLASEELGEAADASSTKSNRSTSNDRVSTKLSASKSSANAETRTEVTTDPAQGLQHKKCCKCAETNKSASCQVEKGTEIATKLSSASKRSASGDRLSGKLSSPSRTSDLSRAPLETIVETSPKPTAGLQHKKCCKCADLNTSAPCQVDKSTEVVAQSSTHTKRSTGSQQIIAKVSSATKSTSVSSTTKDHVSPTASVKLSAEDETVTTPEQILPSTLPVTTQPSSQGDIAVTDDHASRRSSGSLKKKGSIIEKQMLPRSSATDDHASRRSSGSLNKKGSIIEEQMLPRPSSISKQTIKARSPCTSTTCSYQAGRRDSNEGRASLKSAPHSAPEALPIPTKQESKEKRTSSLSIAKPVQEPSVRSRRSSAEKQTSTSHLTEPSLQTKQSSKEKQVSTSSLTVPSIQTKRSSKEKQDSPHHSVSMLTKQEPERESIEARPYLPSTCSVIEQKESSLTKRGSKEKGSKSVSPSGSAIKSHGSRASKTISQEKDLPKQELSPQIKYRDQKEGCSFTCCSCNPNQVEQQRSSHTKRKSKESQRVPPPPAEPRSIACETCQEEGGPITLCCTCSVTESQPPKRHSVEKKIKEEPPLSSTMTEESTEETEPISYPTTSLTESDQKPILPESETSQVPETEQESKEERPISAYTDESASEAESIPLDEAKHKSIEQQIPPPTTKEETVGTTSPDTSEAEAMVAPDVKRKSQEKQASLPSLTREEKIEEKLPSRQSISATSKQESIPISETKAKSLGELPKLPSETSKPISATSTSEPEPAPVTESTPTAVVTEPDVVKTFSDKEIREAKEETPVSRPPSVLSEQPSVEVKRPSKDRKLSSSFTGSVSKAESISPSEVKAPSSASEPDLPTPESKRKSQDEQSVSPSVAKGEKAKEATGKPKPETKAKGKDEGSVSRPATAPQKKEKVTLDARPTSAQEATRESKDQKPPAKTAAQGKGEQPPATKTVAPQKAESKKGGEEETTAPSYTESEPESYEIKRKSKEESSLIPSVAGSETKEVPVETKQTSIVSAKEAEAVPPMEPKTASKGELLPSSPTGSKTQKIEEERFISPTPVGGVAKTEPETASEVRRPSKEQRVSISSEVPKPSSPPSVDVTGDSPRKPSETPRLSLKQFMESPKRRSTTDRCICPPQKLIDKCICTSRSRELPMPPLENNRLNTWVKRLSATEETLASLRAKIESFSTGLHTDKRPKTASSERTSSTAEQNQIHMRQERSPAPHYEPPCTCPTYTGAHHHHGQHVCRPVSPAKPQARAPSTARPSSPSVIKQLPLMPPQAIPIQPGSIDNTRRRLDGAPRTSKVRNLSPDNCSCRPK